MTVIHYRKKHATNDFTALTGLIAVQMLGGSNCLISQKVKYLKISVQKLAYCNYDKCLKSLDNTSLQVSTTCGVANCVKKEHLVAEFVPTQKEHKYIKDYLKIDGHEHLANAFNVPYKVFIKKY